jgi:adenylate kinase family enzyme
MKQRGALIFFCGKMGAGKSTQSKHVAQERNAVLLSEDEWLSSLYPSQITSFEDYIKFSGQLKPLIKAHVKNILETGTNVVMDFPANTMNQRKWFKELVSEANVQHELIYLKVSNELCLKQIEQRRTKQPEKAAFDTEAVFYQVTKYFEEPNKSEGFNLHVIERNA